MRAGLGLDVLNVLLCAPGSDWDWMFLMFCCARWAGVFEYVAVCAGLGLDVLNVMLNILCTTIVQPSCH